MTRQEKREEWATEREPHVQKPGISESLRDLPRPGGLEWRQGGESVGDEAGEVCQCWKKIQGGDTESL